MTSAKQKPAAQGRGVIRHGAGFLVSGTLAFLVDALVLALLNRGAGLDPFVSRLFALSAAMVTAWLAHRRWTFAVEERPSLREFLNYAALAWTVAALNYAIYSAVLLLMPQTDPIVALVIASVAAMGVSYVGMRFGVFRRSGL